MRICGYGRVSTDKKEQENSLINQKSKLDRDIPSAGHEFVGFYYDEGLTGTKAYNRDGFNKMLYDAGLDLITKPIDSNDKRKSRQLCSFIPSETREPLFDEIWISNTSRFIRNTIGFDIVIKLREKGVSIFFRDQSINTRDKSQDFLLQLFQVFDMNDSRDKSVKVRSGNLEGIKRGVIRCNNLLYGYKYIITENRMEIIPEEAKAVELMYDLYLKDYGFRRISKTLATQGIFNREGKPFTISQIRRILSNEKYAGLNNRGKYDSGEVFSKFTYCKVKKSYEVKETDKIPAIIKKDIFDAVQAKKKSKVNYSKSNGIYKGITEYSGLLRCGTCGNVYTANVTKGHKFYNCKTKKFKGTEACNNPNVSKARIDQLTDSLVVGYPQDIRRIIEDHIKETELNIYGMMEQLDNDHSEEVKAKQEQIVALETQYDNLMELYVADIIGDKERIKARMARNEAQRGQIKEEIIGLTHTNAGIIEQIQNELKVIKGYRAIQVKESYSREEVIQSIDKIIVKPDKTLSIEYNVSIDNKEPVKLFENPIAVRVFELTPEKKTELEAKYKKVLESLDNVS